VDVHDVVQVNRRHLVELMQQYTRLKEDLSDAEVALGLVVDAELFRLDGVIRWLDAADGRLRRVTSVDPQSSARPSTPARLRRRVGTAR
jgi:hypothetical protein